VLAGLRAQIDPVFLPRPLIFVDTLPRDGNGKMLAATLQKLIAQHSAAHTSNISPPHTSTNANTVFSTAASDVLTDAAQRATQSATSESAT
jgi:hypothetical protein